MNSSTVLEEGTPTHLTVQGAQRQVTLCQCLRCGNIWKPRKATPSKCPGCNTPLWNVPYAYEIEGKEPPTRTPKVRGKPFQAGFDARRIGAEVSSEPQTDTKKPAGSAQPSKRSRTTSRKDKIQHIKTKK